MGPLRVSARWVIPVERPPIEGGAVLVGSDGRIAAVGRDADVPGPAHAERWDLGDAAVLPGLVNAHSHLELTALRGLVHDLPFPQWIAAVRHVKNALGEADFRASARWGVLESFAAGITATGDTGSSGAAARAMAELGARGVAFHEVFGPDPARADQAVGELEGGLTALRPCESARVAVGVSPHAPYTVSARLLRAVAALARRQSFGVAMHVAESREESLLIERGEGPFADALRRRGLAVEPQRCSPVAWIERCGVLELRPLLIHCVTADDDDFGAIARHRASVAHCPRSNAALGNGRADLAAMRRLGVTVGLGTDSVVAGGRLDLFAEARMAVLGCPLAPRQMLRLVTVDAAAALRLDGVGVLAPGTWGDLTAVSLAAPSLAAAADPEEAVTGCATSGDVVLTVVAGRVVYRRGWWPGVDSAGEMAGLERASAAARAARAGLGGN